MEYKGIEGLSTLKEMCDTYQGDYYSMVSDSSNILDEEGNVTPFLYYEGKIFRATRFFPRCYTMYSIRDDGYLVPHDEFLGNFFRWMENNQGKCLIEETAIEDSDGLIVKTYFHGANGCGSANPHLWRTELLDKDGRILLFQNHRYKSIAKARHQEIVKSFRWIMLDTRDTELDEDVDKELEDERARNQKANSPMEQGEQQAEAKEREASDSVEKSECYE